MTLLAWLRSRRQRTAQLTFEDWEVEQKRRQQLTEKYALAWGMLIGAYVGAALVCVLYLWWHDIPIFVP